MDHIYQNPSFGEEWFSYPNLYSSAVREFPSGSKFVEIGSWKGKSAAYMAVEIANSGKDIEFVCVDPWDVEHNTTGTTVVGNELYNTFMSNMKPVEKYFKPLRMTSVEASKLYADNSLDFVFIDGSHLYDDVLDDIAAWYPKVKVGGILSGHDYYIGDNYGHEVKVVVDQLFTMFQKSENCWIHRKLLDNLGYKGPDRLLKERENRNKPDKHKMADFPSVYAISTVEAFDRRKSLIEKFGEYDIPVNIRVFSRNIKNEVIASGLGDKSSVGTAIAISHLKSIKKWYDETNEEYAFFCEDDVSLETVKYWNFTWKEFFTQLPSDWECVQLAWMRELPFAFGDKIRNRCWCDWSAAAFMLKRSFAKKLLDTYYPDGRFHLEVKGVDAHIKPYWALTMASENILFSNIGRVYSFMMFVEDMNHYQNETACLMSGEVSDPYMMMHSKARNDVLNWWKSVGKDRKLEDSKEWA